MVNYVRSAATAKRLIEANGRTVSLVRLSRTPDDANKPWRGPTIIPDSTLDPASYPSPKAVIFPYSEEDTGGLVKSGDKFALIAATSTEVSAVDVETYDGLLDGDTLYRILQANPLAPGTVEILYELHLRN